MITKEILSIEEKNALYKIGSDLKKDFLKGNEEVVISLGRAGVDDSYIINRLITDNLGNVLTSERILKEKFERTDGQVGIQLGIALQARNAEKISRVFRFLDAHGENLICLRAIDWLLGIQEVNENSELLKQRYGNEQYEYQGTPYEFIADFLHALNLGPEDVLYDLGSGYGRIPLYAALTTSCGKCKGVEIVPERVKISQNAAKNLLLPNVEFIQANVVECDFSDGTAFFLFNPFTWQTLEKVGEKFKKIASEKKIRIVTWGGPSVAFLERQSWLRPKLVQVKELTRPMSWGMYIFESQK